MHPIDKKWQFYYVFGQLRESAPNDNYILIKFKSFKLDRDYIKTYIEQFKNDGIVKLIEKLNDEGFLVSLINKNKLEEEYNTIKEENEKRISEYMLRKRGAFPIFNVDNGILLFGGLTSVFDKDSDVYLLYKYMAERKLKPCDDLFELFEFIHGKNYGREIAPEELQSIRHTVRALNNKIRNDLKIDEDFFEYKVKTVRFRIEIFDAESLKQ